MPVKLWPIMFGVSMLAWAAHAAAQGAASPVSGHLDGKVVDASTGEPIGGSIVAVKELPSTGVISEKDGTFTIQSLKPGLYTLVAKDPRHWPSEMTNCQVGTGAGQPHTIKLTTMQFALIHGKETATPTQTRSFTQMIRVAQDANDLQSQYLLRNALFLSDSKNSTAKYQAEAAQSALESKPTRLSGVVVDPSGLTLQNTTLTFTDSKSGRSVTTTSDTDGKYEVTFFPLGEYTLSSANTGTPAQAPKLEVTSYHIPGVLTDAIAANQPAKLSNSLVALPGAEIQSKLTIGLPAIP